MQTHTHTYIHMVEYYTVFKMNEEALYILNMESSSICETTNCETNKKVREWNNY